MGVGRSRLLRPVRDALGRRAHRLIDRRVREQLASAAPAPAAPQIAERVHGPAERLRVAPSARLRDAFLDLEGGRIDIGAHAVLGYGVKVVTSDPAAGGAGDVRIEDEARIGSGAIVIGPCTVGARAEVAAGVVVTGDVPPAARVREGDAQILRRPTPIPPAVEVVAGSGRLFVPAATDDSAPAVHDPFGASVEHASAVRAAARPGTTVVDVGARAGWTAVAAAEAVGPTGQVLAFEPDAALRRLIRANLARRGLQNVDVRSEAIGEESVPSLDQLAASAGDVSALTIVTSGTEHLVVREAAGLLERHRPVVLVRFWPDGIRRSGAAPDRVLDEYRARSRSFAVLEAPELAGSPSSAVVAAVDARPSGRVTLQLEPT